MTEPLNPDEHAAIAAYALARGENWKDQLLADWMEGRTQGTLQHLRNTRGPSWLADYSLADWPKSLFSGKRGANDGIGSARLDRSRPSGVGGSLPRLRQAYRRLVRQAERPPRQRPAPQPTHGGGSRVH